MTTHTSTAQRSSKYPTTIGIDVGGTGMKGGLVRLGSGPKAGTLRGDRFRIPTPQPAMPEPVAATLAAITAELDGREKAPKPSAPLGVCFPSIVKDGVCLSANNIDHSWIGTDLRGTFEEHLRRPVTVVNDADAAGLAEARYGAGRGVRGLVHVITLGTGIGGADHLVQGRAHVMSVGIRHGLHADRGIAPHRHIADHDLSGLPPLDIAPGTDRVQRHARPPRVRILQISHPGQGGNRRTGL